jgi:hypothetical protein
MPSVVRAAEVENLESLKAHIGEQFKKGRYFEITQAIGMHSAMIDSKRMIDDQRQLFGLVLNLLKERIGSRLGKEYGAWYTSFPQRIERLAGTETDKNTAAILSSRLNALGSFKSADDFFFWGLNGRRLSLEEIAQYFEKSTA